MGMSKHTGPQSKLQETERSVGTRVCLGNKCALLWGRSVKCHRQMPLLWHQLQCRRTTGIKIDLNTGPRLKITCVILQHLSTFQNTLQKGLFQPCLKCNYFFPPGNFLFLKTTLQKVSPMGKLHLGYYYFPYLLTSGSFGWLGL